MRYVVVHWSETNNTSIMEEHSIKDVSLLRDSSKEGMIYHKDLGKKAPKGGWKAYLGRVVSVHDSVKEARNKETMFLSEDKENSHENVKGLKKKRKYHKGYLSDESDEVEDYSSKPKILPITERKKMAIMTAEKSLIVDEAVRKVSSSDSDIESGDEELQNLSQQELIRTIRSLQKRLDCEQAKQQLCTELPKMLADALESRKVLEKLNELSRATASPPKSSKCLPVKLSNLWSTPKSSSVAQTPKKREILGTVISEQPSTPDQASPGIIKAETPKMEDSQFDVNKVRSLLTPSGLGELDRSKNHSKMTKTLVASLFDRETLQKSTLAGKKGGHMLDAEKVEMIIGYVCKSYPFVTRATVRNIISQKIKDEKEACKRKKSSETARVDK